MKHKDMLPLMGEIVLVEKVLKRDCLDTDGNVKWNARRWWPETIDNPRAGWVVGFRILHNGRMVKTDEWDDIKEPEYFVAEESVHCCLVAFWPTMTPVHVPLDGFRANTDVEPVPPVYPWTDRDRAALRDEMKSVGRDEKGRWQVLPNPKTPG